MHRNDIVDSNILLMRSLTRLAIRLYLSFTLLILLFESPLIIASLFAKRGSPKIGAQAAEE